MNKVGKPLPPYKKAMENLEISFQLGKTSGRVRNVTYKHKTENGQTTRTRIMGPVRRETKHTMENPFPSTKRKKKIF